jgi:hypothetical protein
MDSTSGQRNYQAGKPGAAWRGRRMVGAARWRGLAMVKRQAVADGEGLTWEGVADMVGGE